MNFCCIISYLFQACLLLHLPDPQRLRNRISRGLQAEISPSRLMVLSCDHHNNIEEALPIWSQASSHLHLHATTSSRWLRQHQPNCGLCSHAVSQQLHPDVETRHLCLYNGNVNTNPNHDVTKPIRDRHICQLNNHNNRDEPTKLPPHPHLFPEKTSPSPSTSTAFSSAPLLPSQVPPKHSNISTKSKSLSSSSRTAVVVQKLRGSQT